MLTAAHAMQTKVESVSPKMGLIDLERKLLSSGRGGFPVLEGGKLVGIVSRSDILRVLSIERSTAEQHADFYRTFEDSRRPESGETEAAARAALVGERAGRLTVADAMIRQVITVDPGQPLSELATMMLGAHIHRLPVVDEGRLVGLVTTLDIVRLVAEGRLAPARDEDAPPVALLATRVASGDPLDEARQVLEERLAKLVSRLTAIEKDLRSARDKDSGERAVERENDEVLERLAATEERQVAGIRLALARMEAGKYRVCAQCGKPVGLARQDALPAATRCLACA